MKRCANCRFAVVMAPDEGHCRRFPPTLDRHTGPDGQTALSGTFPVIALSRFWCGEFKRRWWPRAKTVEMRK